ncbi:hypothetical protein R3P38DRAFT_3362890 [Favolaschia claudopus]|uniref:Uncharacterized protein n=1 Tax=Favolaschia claudopus TaxID=2862362 RepID=A0AAW0AKS2_9AGAR
MTPLPVELLEAITKIVKHDGNPDLFSLRLDSVKSARAVAFVQRCDDSLRSLVRGVVFSGDEEVTGRADTFAEDNREALQIVFSGLGKFDNLKTLKLVFYGWFVEEDSSVMPEDPSHYLLLQRQIFRALSSSPPPESLVCLTMENGYKTFSISTLSDAFLSLEASYDFWQEPLVEFWAASMTAVVRACTGLTSLTIRSDQNVGTFTELSFDGISMPHLSLSHTSLADSDELQAEVGIEIYAQDPHIGWGLMHLDLEELPTANLDLSALESLLAVVKSRRSSPPLEKRASLARWCTRTEHDEAIEFDAWVVALVHKRFGKDMSQIALKQHLAHERPVMTLSYVAIALAPFNE